MELSLMEKGFLDAREKYGEEAEAALIGLLAVAAAVLCAVGCALGVRWIKAKEY